MKAEGIVTVIDMHTHVVPKALVGTSAARHRLWPTLEMRDDDRAAVMIDGKVFREIDSRSWEADRRLRDMEPDGTDNQVLSRRCLNFSLIGCRLTWPTICRPS
jgi:aminocarboxymuconate-semialdehyde decarboxylase